MRCLSPPPRSRYASRKSEKFEHYKQFPQALPALAAALVRPLPLSSGEPRLRDALSAWTRSVEMDEEELRHWQLSVSQEGGACSEPDSWEPAGETLPQPRAGPRSQAPRDDLQWDSRPGLPCSSGAQSSSGVLLLGPPADRSEGLQTTTTNDGNALRAEEPF